MTFTSRQVSGQGEKITVTGDLTIRGVTREVTLTGGYQGGNTDPWGNEYYYQQPGDNGEYDLVSYGRDGTTGGEGEDSDVKSWE